jgi:hypothetical protein
LALIIDKAHTPTETLLIQASQLRLIRVVIGRAQKGATQATPGDIRKISLYWVAFYNIHLVKVALGEPERVSIKEFPVHRDSTILAKLIKGRFRLCRETNFIAARFFHEQAGQNEQRIGNRTRLDLCNDVFEYALAREKTDRSLERLWRSLRNPVGRTAIISSIGITTSDAFSLGHSAAGTSVGLGSWPLSISSALTGVEGSVFAPATAIAAALFSGGLLCRVTVVTICRTGFFHPCRQELEIKKIGRLDGRSAHHVHLLEPQTESNAKLRTRHYDDRKLIDILFNSFTCDAVPGVFGNCRT